ncbi:3-dehydroquinate synthase [Bryobacterales bacterium F-183]|nr:3-dehydroquinate synthase [Bryobacterales bacterium F-183]
MQRFSVTTPQRDYDACVGRGVLSQIQDFVPPKTGKIFVLTTRDVWELHGSKFPPFDHVLYFRGGEENKRLAEVEALAEEMVQHGADRSSLLVAVGGGIVTDIGGFLAASFMRGIPVIQVPTTLLAQVDAAVGGKTGVNLVAGKNLFGAFHQPLVVLVDPQVLGTLPEREYRAGLYEIIKGGVIRDAALFEFLESHSEEVLAQQPDAVDRIIADKVRIKCEVVTADEREGDLRRILNFGHTIGHALEAETLYKRFLHGEAVAYGMHAATDLAVRVGTLDAAVGERIHRVVKMYGPIPSMDGISAQNLLGRLASDKKTIQGKVHFVLPTEIGAVRVQSGIDPTVILQSILAGFERAAAA